MFLRVKRSQGRAYLVLVENYREDGKVKQRTHAHFGRVEQVDLAEVRRRLARMPGFAFLRLLEASGSPKETHHHVVQRGFKKR